MLYHVRVTRPGLSDEFVFDLDENSLRSRVASPWHRGEPLRSDRGAVKLDEHATITIVRTDVPAEEVVAGPAAPRHGTKGAALAVMKSGVDVTSAYVTGPPGAPEPVAPERPHDVVVQICDRFPRLVHALAVRYADRPPLLVDDEYDLQYLMFGALSLRFSDVRAEEWMMRHGAGPSRADFLIPEAETIVETKMVRKGLTDNKLQVELADDFERYRRHPDCRYVIALVYDPGKRLRYPDQLQDLSGNRGEIDVRVILVT